MLKYAATRLVGSIAIATLTRAGLTPADCRKLRALCIWTEPSLGGCAFGLVHPGLGFLGSSLIRCEDPRLCGLDFLGFSRPNRDVSMGYPTESEESFFSSLCRRVGTVGTTAHEFSLCKGMIVHGASLSQFLIFCNKLRPSRPCRLHPRATRSGASCGAMPCPTAEPRFARLCR